MKWIKFLFLPLAAWLVGDPMDPPRLRPEFPAANSAECPFAEARRSYLLAWGFAEEHPARAAILVERALKELAGCGTGTELFRERVRTLQQRLRSRNR